MVSGAAVAASPLPEMLGRLKLTAMRDRLDGLLDEAARRELALREALALLCEAEVAHREERRIQMATRDRQVPLRAHAGGLRLRRPALARPPAGPRPRGLPLGRQRRHAAAARARPAWARRTSPWRSGARRCGRATRCCSPRRLALITALAKAQAEGRLEERLTRYAKPKLLIVDEFGYLPLEPHAAHLFFPLVSRRYERGSMLVTSNRSVGEWGDGPGRRRGRDRDPRPAAPPQPRADHPRRQLPPAREAPLGAAQGRRPARPGTGEGAVMPARPGGSTGPSRAVRSPARTGRARSRHGSLPWTTWTSLPAGDAGQPRGAVPDVARGFSR